MQMVIISAWQPNMVTTVQLVFWYIMHSGDIDIMHSCYSTIITSLAFQLSFDFNYINEMATKSRLSGPMTVRYTHSHDQTIVQETFNSCPQSDSEWRYTGYIVNREVSQGKGVRNLPGVTGQIQGVGAGGRFWQTIFCIPEKYRNQNMEPMLTC